MPPSTPSTSSTTRQADSTEHHDHHTEDDWIHVRRTGSPYSASPATSEAGYHENYDDVGVPGHAEETQAVRGGLDGNIVGERLVEGHGGYASRGIMVMAEEEDVKKLEELVQSGLSLLNTTTTDLHTSTTLKTLKDLTTILTAAQSTIHRIYPPPPPSPRPSQSPSNTEKSSPLPAPAPAPTMHHYAELFQSDNPSRGIITITEEFVPPVVVPRKWDMHLDGGLEGLMDEYRELRGEGSGQGASKGKRKKTALPLHDDVNEVAEQKEQDGGREGRGKKRTPPSVPTGTACHGARSIEGEAAADLRSTTNSELMGARGGESVGGGVVGVRNVVGLGNKGWTVFEDVYSSRQRSRVHRTTANPAEDTLLKAIFVPDPAQPSSVEAGLKPVAVTAGEQTAARVVNTKGGAATVFEDVYESRRRGREQAGRAGREVVESIQTGTGMEWKAGDPPIVSYQEAIRPFPFGSGPSSLAEAPLFGAGPAPSPAVLPAGDRAAIREHIKQFLADQRAKAANGEEDYAMGESVLRRARREARAERFSRRPPPQPLPQPFGFFGIARVDPGIRGDAFRSWPERTPATVPYSRGGLPEASSGTIALRYSDLAEFEGSDYPGLAQLMAERLQINAQLITKACLKLDLTEDSPVISELAVQEELRRAIDPELHTSMAGASSWRYMQQGTADTIVKRVVTHYSEVVKQDVAEKLQELGAKEYERRMALHSEMDREKLVGALMREAQAGEEDKEGGEAVETVYEDWIARTRSVLDRLYALLGDVYGEDRKTVVWGQLIRPGGQIDTLVGLARICVMWHDGIAKEKISQKLKTFNV